MKPSRPVVCMLCLYSSTQHDGAALRSLVCLRVLRHPMYYLCFVVCEHRALRTYARQQPKYIERENGKKSNQTK